MDMLVKVVDIIPVLLCPSCMVMQMQFARRVCVLKALVFAVAFINKGMITDYFKPEPRPLASPAPSPVVKQPMQKKPVGRPMKRSSIAVAIFRLPTIRFYGMKVGLFVTEITPNYNAILYKATPMRKKIFYL